MSYYESLNPSEDEMWHQEMKTSVSSTPNCGKVMINNPRTAHFGVFSSFYAPNSGAGRERR